MLAPSTRHLAAQNGQRVSMTEKIFACLFKRGAWDPNQWWMVQSPRWHYQGRWAREDRHIRKICYLPRPAQTRPICKN